MFSRPLVQAAKSRPDNEGVTLGLFGDFLPGGDHYGKECAAQGIGGAMMFGTSLALIAHEFQDRDRGTALGIWGATTAATVSTGPLVGGALVDALSWRWVFLVNAPIGLVASFSVLGADW